MTTEPRTRIFSERNVRKARLGSGLVILVFLLMHLSNHALGLISIEAAEHGRRIFIAIWRNPLGTVVLYGAFILHIFLVLRAIYLRRSLVMPKAEAAQIVLGLLVPILLIDHVIGTRIAHSLYDYRDSYDTIVRLLWVASPFNGVRQSVALVVAWMHGCLGVHFWLRYRPWYPSAAPWLLTLAILLPVLGLLGFVQMGRTVESVGYHETGYPGGYYETGRIVYGSPQAEVQVAAVRNVLYGAFSLALLCVIGLRAGRRLSERSSLITVRYPGGEAIRVPRGFTVLEASRLGSQPHYAVCGGKGQCSTCRVQIVAGEEGLPPAEALEQSTLRRINAAPDVRLACQLRPNHDVTVAPLLVPMAESALPANTQESSPGREREIVVLFCDIRHFTMLTETRLPFDIVFLLNRYFESVGRAVEQAGGRIDKFIGDGAMALFGIGVSPEDACRQALRAAVRIVADIDRLGEELSEELTMPLRLAIGIHTGPAVVGTLGYGRARNLTAIGDTVNVASRLESAAKEFDVAMVVSEPVVALSGVDVTGIESREISIRGRVLPLKVYMMPKDSIGIFA